MLNVFRWFVFEILFVCVLVFRDIVLNGLFVMLWLSNGVLKLICVFRFLWDRFVCRIVLDRFDWVEKFFVLVLVLIVVIRFLVGSFVSLKKLMVFSDV